MCETKRDDLANTMSGGLTTGYCSTSCRCHCWCKKSWNYCPECGMSLCGWSTITTTGTTAGDNILSDLSSFGSTLDPEEGFYSRM